MEPELKIMIIDDDRHLLSLLQKALDMFGLEVKACESGFEAMVNTFVDQYDYIITDYEMPGMDGLELTRRLREKNPLTIIIGISGKDVGEKFLRAGANDFLLKPFLPYRLAMMITGDDILA